MCIRKKNSKQQCEINNKHKARCSLQSIELDTSDFMLYLNGFFISLKYGDCPVD